MPVKVWLPAKVYQQLYKTATRRGFADVGSLLAYEADLACRPKQHRRSWVRVTDELLARCKSLRARGFTYAQISNEVGISAASIHRHLAGDS